MPSNKLSHRRATAQAPHICHPPPPPPFLPLPPPPGTYWIDPTEEWLSPWDVLALEVYAENATYPPEDFFPVHWSPPWGSMYEGGDIGNGTSEWSWWDPEGQEGDGSVICQIYDPTDTFPLATLSCIVHVSEWPPEDP